MPRNPVGDDLSSQGAMLDKPICGELYLGDSRVVGALIADFCLSVREMLVGRSNGQLTAEKFIEDFNELRDRMAGIFSGNNRHYAVVRDRPQQLNALLRVELGSYWESHREENENNPFKAFFSWLCWAVFDSLKRSKSDPDMEQVYIEGHVRTAIKLLLG